MGINRVKLWLSDLDEIISVSPELEELAGKSVMVTGSTGLICSAFVDVFIRWNETHDKKITIFAAGRSKEKAVKRFAPSFDSDWFKFVSYDAASTDNSFDFKCDYIVHGASNASPNKIVKEPVETMLSNVLGVKNILDFARVNGAEKVVYISSSEVYGKKSDDVPSRIGDHGWIDILNPRSSYSIGKCAAETMCSSYYDEYAVESVILRPGHIYGPTAVETDNRVSSAWAYAAARGEDIVMKSDGSQIRSYCYCLDCASAIIKLLIKGKPVCAYNVSNPDSVINIKSMASFLTEAAGVQLKIENPTEAEKKGFNPMTNSSLDSTELLDLGWRCLFDAKRGFAHTVSILKELEQA